MASIIKVDTIQTAAGGTPTAADLGINTTGTVLQVVQTSVETANLLATSSTSFVDTTLGVNITPSSTSSKILIAVNSGMVDTRGAGRQIALTIYRDSTNLGNSSRGMMMGYGDGIRAQMPISVSYLDSPSTTSQIEYSLYAKTFSGEVEVNRDSCRISIIAMEIAG